MELQLIINTGVPKGEPITPYAMMPKVFACIENTGRHRVYVGRKLIRTFIHPENAIKKKDRVFLIEEERVLRIFKKLTKTGPIMLKERLK